MIHASRYSVCLYALLIGIEMGIHISKIYTKSGDKGSTGLVGGKRVAKSSLKIESYGTLDELMSHIGMARTLADKNSDAPNHSLPEGEKEKISSELKKNPK